MKKREILHFLEQLKKKYNVSLYTPYKYFKGLKTKKDILSRFQDILQHSISYSTDLSKKTKPSKYTLLFEQRFGKNIKSLDEKSRITGVPLSILQKVFQKGIAAWKTGHRVGATKEQWGYARVHSFLTLGCTIFSSDFSLFKNAIEQMSTQQKQLFLSQPISCPSSTLQSAFYKKRGVMNIILQWKSIYSNKNTSTK